VRVDRGGDVPVAGGSLPGGSDPEGWDAAAVDALLGVDDTGDRGRPGWAGGTGSVSPSLAGVQLSVQVETLGRRRRLSLPRRRAVTVRLSDEERFDVVNAAHRVGLTPGAYMAEAAVAAARGTAGPKADGRRQVAIELNHLWTQVARLGGNLNQAVKVANATGQIDGRLIGALAQTKGLLDRITVAVDETHAGMRR